MQSGIVFSGSGGIPSARLAMGAISASACLPRTAARASDGFQRVCHFKGQPVEPKPPQARHRSIMPRFELRLRISRIILIPASVWASPWPRDRTCGQSDSNVASQRLSQKQILECVLPCFRPALDPPVFFAFDIRVADAAGPVLGGLSWKVCRFPSVSFYALPQKGVLGRRPPTASPLPYPIWIILLQEFE